MFPSQAPGCPELSILSFMGGFHGRTMGMLNTTIYQTSLFSTTTVMSWRNWHQSSPPVLNCRYYVSIAAPPLVMWMCLNTCWPVLRLLRVWKKCSAFLLTAGNEKWKLDLELTDNRSQSTQGTHELKWHFHIIVLWVGLVHSQQRQQLSHRLL